LFLIDVRLNGKFWIKRLFWPRFWDNECTAKHRLLFANLFFGGEWFWCWNGCESL